MDKASISAAASNQLKSKVYYFINDLIKIINISSITSYINKSSKIMEQFESRRQGEDKTN